MIKKFLLGIFAILIAVVGICVVLSNEKALVVHPEGLIAQKEYILILVNIFLMLCIIVPTYILLFWVVWKYCIKQDNDDYDPEHTFGFPGELAMWGFPTVIVALLSIVTWYATHDLDPYKPLESDVRPLSIQVVALDWKWVFIYPELGIATLNLIHIPEKTPVHLKLTADGAPMNSFWVPQLSGQIYSMSGMTTQLHLMADGPGDYAGRAVEINGEGYSDMNFSVKSTTREEFEAWVEEVKKSSSQLTEEVYEGLVKPAVDKSVVLFSEVEKDLYHKIVHKYMDPAKPVL